MPCPYLAYREGDASRSFDVPRAYCTVVDEFVQPMRADVCNDRYGLVHAADCEYYLAAERDDGGSEPIDRPADAADDTSTDG